MLRVTGERLWYPATRNSSILYRTSYQYSTISFVRCIISDIQHTRLADTLCKLELKIVILAIGKAYRTKPHDDVIKWKHFPRYWPFVRGIPRPPENSPHKGQWRGVLMFYMICVGINGWENNREAGDAIALWRYRAHYDVIVMLKKSPWLSTFLKSYSSHTKLWWLFVFGTPSSLFLKRHLFSLATM